MVPLPVVAPIIALRVTMAAVLAARVRECLKIGAKGTLCSMAIRMEKSKFSLRTRSRSISIS